MSINKLIPAKLNKDADYRLVNSNEAVDMINVRVSDTDTILPAYGNAAVTQVLEAGENRTVGTCVVETTNDTYFLNYNSNGNHGIYRYSFSNSEVVEVIVDSNFDFYKYDFVHTDAIIDSKGDTLLSFTTGRGEPFLINVSGAERGQYNRLVGVDDNVRKLYLTLAKQPPLYAPEFAYTTDETREKNYLIDKMFQFSCQYIYEDNQVSAMSPYSKIAYVPQAIIYDSLSDPFNSPNNKCTITVDASKADVKQVRFLVREGNNGTWYEIGEVDNVKRKSGVNFLDLTVSLDFYNDKLYKAVSADVENKLFDAVPTEAKAMRFSNNRLFFGDYEEGFDNVDIDVDVVVERKEPTAVYNVTARNLAVDLSTASDNTAPTTTVSLYIASPTASDAESRLGIQLDLTDVPSNVKAGSVISVDFSFKSNYIYYSNLATLTFSMNGYDWESYGTGISPDFKETPRLYPTPFVFKQSVVVDVDSTKAQVATLILNSLSQNTITTKISPDLSNTSFATLMRDSDTNSRKWYMWFGGSVTGTFEADVDNQFTEDYVCVRYKLTGANVSVVKAVNDSFEKRGIESGGKPTEGFWTKVVSGQSYYIFKNCTVNYSTSSIFYPKNIKTFKSNSAHNFGLEYQDTILRRSFVMPIDAVTVPSVTDNKSSSLVFNIRHNPPDWANKYAIVYAGNDKYDYYEQYTVAEAFTGNADSYEFDALYVAMRQLEGKPNSFKDSKFPNIEYQYVKGDKLRVLRYNQDSGEGTDGYVQPKGYEFDIVDYKYYDETDTPISVADNPDTDVYRSTGWFLVLRNKEYEGFSSEDIIANLDSWWKDVVVEIYRPKKRESELIYRSVGVDYPILETGGIKYHDGLRYLGYTSTTTLYVYSDTNGVTFQVEAEVYVGDYITFTYSAVEYTYIIASVEMVSDRTLYNITFTEPVTNEIFSANAYDDNAVITSNTTVIKVEDGDAYLRPRLMKINPDGFARTTDDFVKQTQYESQIVEASSLNDFIKSDYYSLGKPNVVSKQARRIHRKSSVTYSDVYLLDSPSLTISSFNNALANWVDYNISYGGIRYMFDDGEALTILQQRKTFVVPVGRNLVEYSDGNANATISTTVISDKPQYILGDFGINNNPESAAKDIYGRKFFADGRQRKVIMIDGGMATAISDIDMETYFSSMFDNFSVRESRYKIYGTCNTENDEYIVAVRDTSTSDLNVYLTPYAILPETPDYAYPVTVDENDLMTFEYVLNDSAIPKWEDEERTWEEMCEEWGENVGWLFIDKIETQPYIYFSEDTIIGGDAAPQIKVIITTTDRLFHIAATYVFASKTLVPEQAATCFYDFGVVADNAAVVDGDTVSFDYMQKHWVTRYSFKPEMMMSANDTFFSFYLGQLYKHSDTATPCYFYGTQYTMDIDLVSNYDPSKTKFYKSLSIEGNTKGGVAITTEDQSTTLHTSIWNKRENEWFAYIPRDESAISWSNYLYIGTLNSVVTLWILEFGLWNDALTWIDTETWVDTPQAGSGVSALRFNNQISMFPIPKGATIYKIPKANFETSQTTPDTNVTYTVANTGMTAKNVIGKRELAFSGTNTLATGDMIYVKKANGVDGDYMRGFWCKFDFTFTPTATTEIYAFNAIYNTSRLHNELGETDRKDE